MGKSNYPQLALDEVEPSAVRQIVSSLQELHQMGKPETDFEVENRINDYFRFCENSSVRPGIESLCLSLHITRTTLFNWANGKGCSEVRQELVQSAKAFIAAFLEQATLQGRLNPASSCFLFKNWCSYHDNISLELPETENGARALTAAELPKLGSMSGTKETLLPRFKSEAVE